MTTDRLDAWGWDDPVLPEPPAWMFDRPELPSDWDQWPTVEELIDEVERLTAAAAETQATTTTTPTDRAAAAADALSADSAPATAVDSRPLEVWQYDDASLLEELDIARRGLSAAQARWLAVLAEVEHRKVTDHVHAMPIDSWLATGTSHSARTARADVRLAGRLRDHTQVATALAAGTMSLEQAVTITNGLAHLPDELSTVEVLAVEADLVGYATQFGPRELRRLTNHAIEAIAPEVAEEHDRRALERAERLQQAGRHVGWKTDPDDGSLRFWGKLPAADGELFKQHLTALAASQRTANALMGVQTSHPQALADALALTVGHHAGCEGGPVKGGDHTRVLITMTLDQLHTGLGIGTLIESDELISVRQVRHLACTSGLMPLVLDGDSLPLDLGRSQRLFTPHQRIALAARDGGCTFPGCDRTPSDCHTHHATNPWHQGGLTDISEGTLLCPHHHHLVEPDPNKPPDKNWTITFDTRGKPVYHSPVQTNGQRIIRQHQRFRQ